MFGADIESLLHCDHVIEHEKKLFKCYASRGVRVFLYTINITLRYTFYIRI